MCANAAGTVLPPFVIFKGQQKLKLTSARQAYPEAFFTSTYAGDVDEDMMLWWFRDHFVKKIPSSGHRPLVLFISRPCLDISLQMFQLAKEERIIFISIPPGVSHLLQPLDDSLSTFLQACMEERARKWENENPTVPFTQKILSQLLQKVWRKGITSDEIKQKFEDTGVFPINAQAISTEKILSAAHILRETQERSPSPQPNQEDLTGLSLLSAALSSHEYQAQIGKSYDSQEVHSVEQDTVDGPMEVDATPTTSRDPYSHPRKRKRLDIEESVVQEDMNVLTEFVPTSVASVEASEVEYQESGDSKLQVLQNAAAFELETADANSVQTLSSPRSSSSRYLTRKRMSSELAQHLTQPIPPKPSVAKLEDKPRVHEEIVQARSNIDQINRAVDSILASTEDPQSLNEDLPSEIQPQAEPSANPSAGRGKKASKFVMADPLTDSPVKMVTRSSPRRSPRQQQSDSSPQKIVLSLSKPLAKDGSKPRIIINRQAAVTTEKPVIKREDPATLSSKSRVTINKGGIEVNVGSAATEVPIADDQYGSPPSSRVSGMNQDFSLAGKVEEQPPQKLLEDEELQEVKSVETVMINGQLFKIIRTAAPSAERIKQELSDARKEPEEEDVYEVPEPEPEPEPEPQVTEELVVQGDGTFVHVVAPQSGGELGVVEEEIVQDYGDFEIMTEEQVV